MSKWQNRFINFEKSYNVLTHDIEIFIANKDNKTTYSLLRAGLIHIYEHTLELSWKTLKDYLEEQSITEINSPKAVIRTAFNNGFIKDGDLWLEMLDDRNIVAHEYDESKADILCNEIINRYVYLIRDLYFMLQSGCF